MTAKSSTTASSLIDQLFDQGWAILPNALPESVIAALDTDLSPSFAETPFCQGPFYGETTKRFGRLLTRSPHAEALVRHPLITRIARQILSPWCDCIQLNVGQAIAVYPGAPAQAPHRDQDMWQAPKGAIDSRVNIIWPLTCFSADNGATLIWPRSHGAQALMPDPIDDPIPVRMEPGSALILLGSTLHGAGANRSAAVRRAVVTGYSLGWLKPYENPWLAYPPEVARKFAPELAALAGYRQHRPNLGNFEGQCPSVLLTGEPNRPLAAIDALRPDQQAMVAAFAARQG
jgi:ectoine hydroxylase-related dioxygenase (phytanoyl-CoA dioxygenase family)